MTDIHGLKPALMMGPGLFFWTAVVLVMTLVGGVLWWWGSRSASSPGAGPVARPRGASGVSALGQLQRMGKTEWLKPERGREFHFQLSQIVRAVLGAHFKCPAQRMTTSELLAQLESASVAAGELGRLGALLEGCDLVKFSDASVREEEMVSRLREACLLVTHWGDVAVQDQSRETGALVG